MAKVTKLQNKKPQTFDEEDLLTLDELCEFLKVGRAWVYRQTREGNIPFIKLGKYLRFERTKLKRWLQGNSYGSE
jgi:excisionase family DNA binding protein